MSDELKKLSFEEWISFVFDHPVRNPQWYFADTIDWWPAEKHPATTITYLTHLFDNPVSPLALYSDDQIGQGLWFLVDNAASNHMFCLEDQRVPWEQRHHAIRAMIPLFKSIFAVRCTPHLGHLSETDTQLNLACYMWWDIMPVGGTREIDTAFIDVMETTLTLPSDACRESALHGLGHWYDRDPQRVEGIIDSFLDSTPKLRAELREYARAARTGCIL
jgi:hypothetical protein